MILDSGKRRSITDPSRSGWIVLEALVIFGGFWTCFSFAITGVPGGVWRSHTEIGLNIHRYLNYLYT